MLLIRKKKQCGYMEHGLTHNVLCTKTYDQFRSLFWSPAGSQHAARSARICEARLLTFHAHAKTSTETCADLIKQCVFHGGKI